MAADATREARVKDGRGADRDKPPSDDAARAKGPTLSARGRAEAARRRGRLEAALRENLRRRKAQQRGRAEGEGAVKDVSNRTPDGD
jgi:hypothetical protein